MDNQSNPIQNPSPNPIPNPIPIDRLKELIGHPIRYVRANALAAAFTPVQQDGGDAYALLLADCVHDSYRNVRSTAVSLLSRSKSPVALPPLREALEELRTKSRVDPKTVKAFEMLVYHSLSPAVVAEQLGISTHDVYLAKSRVAAKLREIVLRLESEYEETPGEWDAAGARPSDGLRA